MHEWLEAGLIDLIEQPDFPCVGAKSALAQRGFAVEAALSILAPADDLRIHDRIARWSREPDGNEGTFRSLAVAFAGPRRLDEKGFEAALWARLSALTAIDRARGFATAPGYTDDPREILSNGRTFDYEESMRLTTGARLWSNRSRVMLTIIEDTAPHHDFLLTPCSRDTFRHFYPDKPVHRRCLGNLAEALAPFGVEPDRIPVAFNIFMNVTVAPDGRLAVLPPRTKPGDLVRFRAEMDLVVGLTACSAYASNGGTFKPIDFAVMRAL